ncbi:Pre-mRNA-splicing factor SPF27 [Apiosordaria backusii]|uniref:Pre-mRNA-splicing factor SPF27 n=1 Tax=Apiosordaria backusii TaxID=314023 RepID=A0AA40BK30_9PEZI|nr:Pre-mRNA-splicing factor SPF27 [Apiosordaria backusii]
MSILFNRLSPKNSPPSTYPAIPPSQDPHLPHPSSLSTELSKAYISHSYVSSRRAHLALLDTYGKNAWLTGNYFLEGELKQLEKELQQTKTEIDLITLARKTQQEEAGPEMKLLEENWKAGVGRVLETELAAEEVSNDKPGAFGLE